MARVHTSKFVARAGKTRLPVKRVDVGTPTERLVLRCGKGDYIEKGETYLWFAPGFRALKQIRCTKHRPRPSELDGSIFAEVLAAQENATDALAQITWNEGDTADDIRQQVNDAIQEIKDAIESVADQYDSAAEAMGGGYGAGSQFEEWASTLRDADIADWTAEDYDDPDDGDEDARCPEHTPESEGGNAVIDDEADDAYDSAETLEQAAEDCSECRALRQPDLTDWTADLVNEAEEKVNDVNRE